ncbi:MAG TPA: hypothetical protein VES96_00520 [Nitrospiraceae bacterium]|nr:hypothetical protein [Nitrospiraceae bacterium]
MDWLKNFFVTVLKPLLIWVVVVLILAAGGYLFFVFNWSYSDGDRAGYLQKISRKGWICKTYEGELAMTTVPGVAPVLWTFSVKMWDDPLAQQINGLLGKKVVLHYREFRYLPSTCFGETPYFVDSVKSVD